ncbi:heavy metal-binding domain-containing protein [Aliiglaciecola sp. LCG003]|uniref:heavy metal-binding domain-containing protein n=1 Tax=Aliiglaciecola sp. LCG003 TaxID=3053655 RepID=UPI002573817A|nr:heavy metal-binding domain-containing protein [Aliiglaciecola sp. LCG003]WJG08230.1 heavy metal-binding domain-containing protein [Aliiglaciecola sp. LCG003]
MLVTTTHHLDGKKIDQYYGIVVGEAVMGANVIKDIFASIRDVVGGRAGSYEKELTRARKIAFSELTEEARMMGANAVIGVDIDYQVIGQNGSMLMVSICGTAVKFQD